MKLRIHATEREVTTLGPGRRYVIWVQGCLRRCSGCISPETWSLEAGYEKEVEQLAEEIAASGCEGLTISGGEPFLQAEALTLLLQKLREKRDMGVWVYSGNCYEELLACEDVWVQRLLSLCDLLIDGAYEEEQNDGKNLRGSANQRAICLSERYRKEANEIGTKAGSVEFFVHESITRMVGIPSRELLEKLKKLSWSEW